MPKEKKNLCVDSLRHAEYYDMLMTLSSELLVVKQMQKLSRRT